MSMNTSKSSTRGRVRVKRPERVQIEWRPVCLDQLLATDHRARLVWAYVESLDMSRLYERIAAVEGRAGRDAVDPRILLALWMFATIEGISSARHIDRLCERDLAYMWICGGVGVNYHLLSDFRADCGDFLDQLLTDTVATMLHQELITLDTVAQDGMRVRASAGSSSFRRGQTLEDCRRAAAKQVDRLRQEREDAAESHAGQSRREAAQLRAATDRQQRLDKALEELKQLEQQKERRAKGSGKKARCSSTDPEARVMKMADSGFRPAYNVQFVTDAKSRIIAGVDVTNCGSDGGQMGLMHEQLQARYDKLPEHYLVDGGFATKDDITRLEKSGTQVFAPIPRAEETIKKGQDPHARQPGDSDQMAEFRQRMATDEAKTRYRQRPSIAEFPNAVCRNHGLHQFKVRGLRKVTAEALLHAVTFNLQRIWKLAHAT